MKHLCFVLNFLFLTSVGKAQNCLSTIDDLKYFIGFKTSEIQKVASKKGYDYYSKGSDRQNGSIISKKFENEDEELILEVLCEDGKVVGAVSDQFCFSKSDYEKMLAYLKSNNYRKVISGKGDYWMSDYWESSDGQWTVRFQYTEARKNQPQEFSVFSGTGWH